MQPDEQRRRESDDQRTLSSPYGPHPDHRVDEAAGGADSSPAETLSSDEREARHRSGPPPAETPVPRKD